MFKRLKLALALTAALMGPAAGRALAADPARLNINVGVQGIALVSDLTAGTGASSGTVSLTWTEPSRNGVTLPASYEVRVSSTGNIDDPAAFAAAAPLSQLSPSPIPSPGAGGGTAGFVVTGLTPAVTYYFAIRERDSDAPVHVGLWMRGTLKNWNPNNFAQAKFDSLAPEAITDLDATPTGLLGQVRLTWTAPESKNGVPVSTYTIKYNILSIANLAGDTTAWFNLPTSSTIFVTPAKSPGGAEQVLVNSLNVGTSYFFAIKSENIAGEVSLIDTKAQGVTTQAQVNLIDTIDVTASTGTVSGAVDLSWFEPFTGGLTPPLSYLVRASSVANIDDNAAFDLAAPLSALSGSIPPVPGAGGSPITFPVTGLTPGVTYYFAVRIQDSDAPAFISDWIRSGATNLKNFAAAHFIPNAPDPVTNLSALTGANEGEITLSWTAPINTNFVPMASYDLRFASFSAAALAGDTTAWFSLAASTVIAPAQAQGQTVSALVAGLNPLSTYYFALKSADVRGEVSLIDTLTETGFQPFALPKNDVPATPAGFAALAGLNRVFLSWTDLSAAQKGVDFGFYKLYRSTEEAAGFVQLTTTTATAYEDRPLTPFVTYYFRLTAHEQPGGLESLFTSTVSAIPFTLAPMEPFGLRVARTSSTLTLDWTQTTRYEDGTPFISTDAPTPDEFQGYRVFRATEACAPGYLGLSSAAVFTTSFSTDTGGNSYFYQVRGFNTLGHSTASFVISSLGDGFFFLDDCSQVAFSEDLIPLLSSATNGLGADIRISRRRRVEDLGNGVIQSVEYRPMLGGVTELKNWYLPKPVPVVLRFGVQNGEPAPLGVGAAGAGTGGGLQAGSVQHLGIYWHNGEEYKKLYGKVDPAAQTIVAETPNLGLFQVRTLYRAAGAVFDLSNLSSRVITPNGDGLNDVMIFTYDPGPNNAVPTGRVMDLQGRHVADMTFGLVPNTLVWDGKSNGRAVTGGVYVYQIQGDGKTFNGTIVIAR